MIVSSVKDGYTINIRCYPGNLERVTDLFLKKLFESKSFLNEPEFHNLKKDKEKSLRNLSKQNSLVTCDETIKDLIHQK